MYCHFQTMVLLTFHTNAIKTCTCLGRFLSEVAPAGTLLLPPSRGSSSGTISPFANTFTILPVTFIANKIDLVHPHCVYILQTIECAHRVWNSLVMLRYHLSAVSVHQSVCHSHGSAQLYCAKTAEQIKILFGINTLGGPRNIVLDGRPKPQNDGRGIRCSFRQITLVSCSISIRYRYGIDESRYRHIANK